MAWLGFDMIQFILLDTNRQPVCSCREQLEWPICKELDDKPYCSIRLCPFPCSYAALTNACQSANKEVTWQ